MTIDEAIQDLGEFQRRLKTELASKLGTVVANDLGMTIRQRVLTGKNSSGGTFSNYSTKPTYINTSENSPKTLPPKGKTGRTKFKSGKSHKTTYFESGYREFRGAIGRSQRKNFELSGEMWRGFGVTNFGETQKGAKATLGGRTPVSKERLEANSEQERTNIIEPSQGEIKEVTEILENEVQRLIEQML